MSLRRFILCLSTLAALMGVFWIVNASLVGRRLDSYRGVDVLDNGYLFFRSCGRHYAPDGYYYGQKWQCVEFIKRFYHQSHGHRMPNVMGHAKDFFDGSVAHGAMNMRRSMLQFRNRATEPPRPDDLLVFTDTKFGHVAIITQVTANSVEVVQQNIIGRPRQTFTLKRNGDTYSIESPRCPAGWLRLRAKAGNHMGTIAPSMNTRPSKANKQDYLIHQAN